MPDLAKAYFGPPRDAVATFYRWLAANAGELLALSDEVQARRQAEQLDRLGITPINAGDGVICWLYQKNDGLTDRTVSQAVWKDIATTVCHAPRRSAQEWAMWHEDQIRVLHRLAKSSPYTNDGGPEAWWYWYDYAVQSMDQALPRVESLPLTEKAA